jgi:hypothetical protein
LFSAFVRLAGQLAADEAPRRYDTGQEVEVGGAWEEREDLGWPMAFVRSVRQLARSPRSFFGTVHPERGLAAPLSFAIVASTLGFVLETLMLLALAPLVLRFFPGAEEALRVGVIDPLGSLPEWALSFLGCQALLLGLPLTIGFYIVFCFVGSGITHLGVLLTGGPSAGFLASFAATCYAFVAALLQVIPGVGDPAFIIGLVVLQVIGLEVLHGVKRWQAVTAAMMPLAAALVSWRLLGGLLGERIATVT